MAVAGMLLDDEVGVTGRMSSRIVASITLNIKLLCSYWRQPATSSSLGSLL